MVVGSVVFGRRLRIQKKTRDVRNTFVSGGKTVIRPVENGIVPFYWASSSRAENSERFWSPFNPISSTQSLYVCKWQKWLYSCWIKTACVIFIEQYLSKTSKTVVCRIFLYFCQKWNTKIKKLIFSIVNVPRTNGNNYCSYK